MIFLMRRMNVNVEKHIFFINSGYHSLFQHISVIPAKQYCHRQNIYFEQLIATHKYTSIFFCFAKKIKLLWFL